MWWLIGGGAVNGPSSNPVYSVLFRGFVSRIGQSDREPRSTRCGKRFMLGEVGQAQARLPHAGRKRIKRKCRLLPPPRKEGTAGAGGEAGRDRGRSTRGAEQGAQHQQGVDSVQDRRSRGKAADGDRKPIWCRIDPEERKTVSTGDSRRRHAEAVAGARPG